MPLPAFTAPYADLSDSPSAQGQEEEEGAEEAKGQSPASNQAGDSDLGDDWTTEVNFDDLLMPSNKDLAVPPAATHRERVDSWKSIPITKSRSRPSEASPRDSRVLSPLNASPTFSDDSNASGEEPPQGGTAAEAKASPPPPLAKPGKALPQPSSGAGAGAATPKSDASEAPNMDFQVGKEVSKRLQSVLELAVPSQGLPAAAARAPRGPALEEAEPLADVALEDVDDVEELRTLAVSEPYSNDIELWING